MTLIHRPFPNEEPVERVVTLRVEAHETSERENVVDTTNETVTYVTEDEYTSRDVRIAPDLETEHLLVEAVETDCVEEDSTEG